ncbi:hypothetical protein J5N97_015821 [Dioscorea zingiberensis]|uniref:Uncharacterized protein n=1 Tax=Dioscorea zingiberensis TaxID=325984 RepID=A0A9D5CII7_9LILI|nr:hypothetical protein J5N97_015821 [Dioscorea zingiberensis]
MLRRFVWDWPSVARGEGFVPPKHYVPRVPDLAGYLMSRNIGENHDCQNEEEAIVYRGTSQSEFNTRANFNQLSQSLPSGLSEASIADKSGLEDLSWVQPGDIQGLKGQIVRLLEMSGGSMLLVRIPTRKVS